MKIFYGLIDNKITDINDLQSNELTKSIEATSIEEFRNKIIQYEELDNELEEKLIQIFEDNSVEENLSLKTFDIKHWVSNRSFGELIDMFITDEIMKPNMQRNFVWDSLKCSRLIESIILGLPIPPLFLLEIDKNKYEIIDGYQRIMTLVNFVQGNPWNYNIKNDEMKKGSPARLSGALSEEISKRTFIKLSPDHQRMIKRSTIPLIEFSQVNPDNYDSKYLIFERINTGSEKLNPMQIRKSLAYGDFMEDLYESSVVNEDFTKLFSMHARKKDVHVEAYLRVYAMTKVFTEDFIPQKSGIKNILNEFCEVNRSKKINNVFKDTFDKAISKVFDIFGEKDNIFKRMDIGSQDKFVGNINVSILEAFLGVLILNISDDKDMKNENKMLSAYKLKMHQLSDEALIPGVDRVPNPFTTSTGSFKAIKRRFSIFKEIVEE